MHKNTVYGRPVNLVFFVLCPVGSLSKPMLGNFQGRFVFAKVLIKVLFSLDSVFFIYFLETKEQLILY